MKGILKMKKKRGMTDKERGKFIDSLEKMEPAELLGLIAVATDILLEGDEEVLVRSALIGFKAQMDFMIGIANNPPT